MCCVEPPSCVRRLLAGSGDTILISGTQEAEMSIVSPDLGRRNTTHDYAVPAMSGGNALPLKEVPFPCVPRSDLAQKSLTQHRGGGFHGAERGSWNLDWLSYLTSSGLGRHSRTGGKA